jgi:hypothetical protein
MNKVLLPLVIAGAALALAACASQPAHQPHHQKSAQNQKQRTVCVSGMATGSHIVHTHCTKMTVAQYKAYKKAQETRQEKDRQAVDRINTHRQLVDCKKLKGGC